MLSVRIAGLLAVLAGAGCSSGSSNVSTFADDGDDEVAFLHVEYTSSEACVYYETCVGDSDTGSTVELQLGRVQNDEVIETRTLFEREDLGFLDQIHFCRSKGFISFVEGSRLHFADLEGGQEIMTFDEVILAAIPSRDCSWIAVVSPTQMVRFVDPVSHTVKHTSQFPEGKDRWRRWDDEGSFYASANDTAQDHHDLSDAVGARPGEAMQDGAPSRCYPSETNSSPLSPNGLALGADLLFEDSANPDLYYGQDLDLDTPKVYRNVRNHCEVLGL